MQLFYFLLGLLPLGWIINGVLTYSTANSIYPKSLVPEHRKVYFRRNVVIMLGASLLFIISSALLSWLLSTTQVGQQVSPALLSIWSVVWNSMSSYPYEWIIAIVVGGSIGYLLGRA